MSQNMAAQDKLYNDEFPLSDVTLLEGPLKQARDLNVSVLLQYDCDRMLAPYRKEAGLDPKKPTYPNWDGLDGHVGGHYLSALAINAATGSDECRKRLEYMISELQICADANDKRGEDWSKNYVGGFPGSAKLWSTFRKGDFGTYFGSWAPFYNLHKMYAGLRAAWLYCDNQQAKQLFLKFCDWAVDITSDLNDEQMERMLGNEHGGMDEVLADAYALTGQKKYLDCARRFAHKQLLTPMENHQDCLDNMHANTQIPKVVGFQRIAELSNDALYHDASQYFWEIVTRERSLALGGNSRREHFPTKETCIDYVNDIDGPESCNTYNMLKLTRKLFKITGNRKYADYYENTFINAIMSSQNPETGMTTYFQPMATGFFKVYSSETEHFWCCTGSGMENFSKLGDSIYFKDENSVYVIRYTSSKLTWPEKGITLTQNANLPDVTFTVGGSAEADIVLRVPDWCSGKPTVKINGTVYEETDVDDFIRLSGQWQDGDIIEYNMPMGIEVHDLQDNENAVAFKYGPWVLSANLGNKDMQTSTTGVNVTVPLLDTSISDIITVKDGSIESWLKNIDKNLLRQGETLNFDLMGTDRELTFSPHYMQHKNRYGIYFKLADADTEVKENEADKYTVIDSLPLGNDQYEFSHNLKSELSNSGNHLGLMFRDAAPGGFFSYEMTVDNKHTNYLAVKYFSGDVGRSFKILLDGKPFEAVTVENVNPGSFYDVYYKIPGEFIADKDKITVTFKADTDSFAGGIFDKLSIVKEK